MKKALKKLVDEQLGALAPAEDGSLPDELLENVAGGYTDEELEKMDDIFYDRCASRGIGPWDFKEQRVVWLEMFKEYDAGTLFK